MLTRQEARVARRDAIRRRLRKLRRVRGKLDNAAAAVVQRRHRLLRQHGAKSDEHLQELVSETVRVENLRREHEQLQHDLAAAIGERVPQGTGGLSQFLGQDATKMGLSPSTLRATLQDCSKARRRQTSPRRATIFAHGWPPWKKTCVSGSKRGDASPPS